MSSVLYKIPLMAHLLGHLARLAPRTVVLQAQQPLGHLVARGGREVVGPLACLDPNGERPVRLGPRLGAAPREVQRAGPVWKSTSELGYPEKYCVDLREPPRHRADAVTGTTSRRWRRISTPSSRCSYRNDVSRRWRGRPRFVSTQVACAWRKAQCCVPEVLLTGRLQPSRPSKKRSMPASLRSLLRSLLRP